MQPTAKKYAEKIHAIETEELWQGGRVVTESPSTATVGDAHYGCHRAAPVAVCTVSMLL